MLTHTGPERHVHTRTRTHRCIQRMQTEKRWATPRQWSGRGLDYPMTQLPGTQCARTHTHTHTAWEGTTCFIGAFRFRATRNQDLVLGKKAPLSAGTRAVGAAAASYRIRARPVPHPGEEGQARPGIEGEGAGLWQTLPPPLGHCFLTGYTGPRKPVSLRPGHSAPSPGLTLTSD